MDFDCFLKFISLLLIGFIILMLIGEYAPFLAMPLWIILIVALVICLYYAIKLEMKNFKNRKE
ncbi:hypothetical protein DW143_23895 [Bacillus sonorensis]|nr:hypothetical protein DW143_23895 [Bacillus sonorensis]